MSENESGLEEREEYWYYMAYRAIRELGYQKDFYEFVKEVQFLLPQE